MTLQNGVVTGIISSLKRPGRFSIEVDDAELATLTMDTIERLGVRIGRQLDDALIASIVAEAQLLGTFDRAVRMLAARARSARELQRRLVQKGEPAEASAAAIERLIVAGFLNDGCYARQFARARMTGAGIARRRLKQELMRKGVDGIVAERAIGDMVTDDAVDEDAILERVARKKLRSLSAVDDITKRRRLFGFLARRGYDVADIQRVTREILGVSSETASDDTASRLGLSE
ncbi:MAG: recombination regulator RecX [Gemmatimonadota bacterium]|nr:recombination regulator RecX [Gemmatimonadota bacterium]